VDEMRIAESLLICRRGKWPAKEDPDCLERMRIAVLQASSTLEELLAREVGEVAKVRRAPFADDAVGGFKDRSEDAADAAAFIRMGCTRTRNSIPPDTRFDVAGGEDRRPRLLRRVRARH